MREFFGGSDELIDEAVIGFRMVKVRFGQIEKAERVR